MYRKSVIAAILLLYGCATLQFIRFYSESTTFYLNMPAYLAGHERLPFQERVLPILFLKPLTDSQWVMHRVAHAQGAFTPQRGPFYLLSFIAFVVAAIYTQRFYNLVTSRKLLAFLVFPVFLFAVMWTYSIHSEADFSYPYDLPSVAFFAAGLYYIYARRYLPLVLIIIAGTFNRETTLFLIGIFVLDAATQEATQRLNLRLVPWLRVALLLIIWLAIKLSLAHHFAGNDASESYLRLNDNLHQLRPRLLPALLNICGYTVPLVLLFHRRLYPLRFRNYLWILPFWFGVMFCSGVIVETRIYGELCSFSAIALVLIMERSAETALASHADETAEEGLRPDPRLVAPAA
jgi:hypothetical protein